MNRDQRKRDCAIIVSSPPNVQIPFEFGSSESWVRSMFSRESDIDLHRGHETADILGSIGVDEETITAGLLLGWSPLRQQEEELTESRFGEEVIGIYRGAREILEMAGWLIKENGNVGQRRSNEENFRKMLIAMVDDVRVVLVCLAFQLANLRVAKELDPEFQKAQSRITSNVYAPLANRLGIWQLKWELEDLAFRYSHPSTYKALAHALDEKRMHREQYIESLIEKLYAGLSGARIQSEIHGRPKHIYSIWKKMERKGLEFGDLWDIRAVRIMVESIDDCYAALGFVHSMWSHHADEYVDYISTPKANGYRSIHTVIEGPEGKSVEIQIRTFEMHNESELGLAAHWRYKEGVGRDTSIESKVAWLRQLLEWKQEMFQESGASSDTPGIDGQYANSPEIVERIYVFTPRGAVIDLPEGSTPIDFSYAIHSEVGHRTRGAKVNERMVPLDFKLRTGDLVNIQTAKSGGPSRDWLRSDLGYVCTGRARSRIQHWFKKNDYAHYVSLGRTMLDKELRRLQIEDVSYEKIAQQSHLENVDDLFSALGGGAIKISKVLQPFKKEINLDGEVVRRKRRAGTGKKGNFTVHGVGNLLTQIAKCCNPLPGEPIVGYITSGRGVTIHKQDCENVTDIESFHADRLVEVDWGEQADSGYIFNVEVLAFHRSGLLHDITENLKSGRIDVLKVNMETDSDHVTRVVLQLDVPGEFLPGSVANKLSSIQNVMEVRRLS